MKCTADGELVTRVTRPIRYSSEYRQIAFFTTMAYRVMKSEIVGYQGTHRWESHEENVRRHSLATHPAMGFMPAVSGSTDQPSPAAFALN